MLGVGNNLKQEDIVTKDREGETQRARDTESEKDSAEEVDAELADLGEIRKNLEQEKKKSESLMNRLLYARADLENYRKQVSKEFEDQSKFGKREIIRKLIDVKEDISRAMQNINNSDLQEVATGLKIIVANVDAMLAEEGVRLIEAVGKNFDPNLHEAVSFSSEEGKDSGIIISEMRQGYMIHDRVLRASMVSVAGDAGESKKEETDDKLVDVQEGGD